MKKTMTISRRQERMNVSTFGDFSFLDLDDSVRYFERHFQWCDTEHLHSGIDYVTPEQCHLGLRDRIVSECGAKLDK